MDLTTSWATEHGILPDPPLLGKNMKFDKDGDSVVNRRLVYAELNIDIERTGYSIWKGGLLLVEFMMHHHKEGTGKVIELGAGTGFLAKVLKMHCNASSVLVTDVDEHVLEHMECEGIRKRVLDWRAPGEMKEQFDTIVASDTLYDDELAVAFINTLELLLNSSPMARCYLAMEKRITFCAINLKPIAMGNDVFMERIQDDHSSLVGERIYFEDVPHIFSYPRSPKLEIWRITRRKFVKDILMK